MNFAAVNSSFRGFEQARGRVHEGARDAPERLRRAPRARARAPRADHRLELRPARRGGAGRARRVQEDRPDRAGRPSTTSASSRRSTRRRAATTNAVRDGSEQAQSIFDSSFRQGAAASPSTTSAVKRSKERIAGHRRHHAVHRSRVRRLQRSRPHRQEKEQAAPADDGTGAAPAEGDRGDAPRSAGQLRPLSAAASAVQSSEPEIFCARRLGTSARSGCQPICGLVLSRSDGCQQSETLTNCPALVVDGVVLLGSTMTL